MVQAHHIKLHHIDITSHHMAVLHCSELSVDMYCYITLHSRNYMYALHFT